jgi:hypothetical protein
MALIAFVALASLAGIGGCSSAATTAAMPTMPAEFHNLPTVLGPLSGSGNKTLTVAVRATMSIEMGCLGKGSDIAWARSPIGGFAVPCGSPGNESFGGSYDSVQELRADNVKVGQRVSVRITVPAGDTWQLWITGGPASLTLQKPKDARPFPSCSRRSGSSAAICWYSSATWPAGVLTVVGLTRS